MIQYDAIRLLLSDRLSKIVGVPVINMNSDGPIPKRPFMTYSLIDGFGDPVGMPIYTQENNNEVIREHVSFSASFLAYGRNNSESTNLALAAMDFFKMAAKEYMREIDVVARNIGSLSNRDIQIEGEQERRMGFDVDFRTNNTIRTPLLEWIEKANITRSE